MRDSTQARRRVDLRKQPVVGLGSVCRRQCTTSAGNIVSTLAHDGLRLHGFGFKLTGLKAFGKYLVSADSMAWSFHERRERTGRQNSLEAALEWYSGLTGFPMRELVV